MSPSAPCGLVWPGEHEWESWLFPGKGPPRRVKPEELVKAGDFVLALPTRSLLSLPLWLPTQANACEMAALELAARHLVRRNQPIEILEIERQADRALVLAVAIADDPEAQSGAVLRAARVEAPARLLARPDGEGIVWKELGEVCYGFLRGGRAVFFASTGEAELSPAVAAGIARAAQRLEAEEILASLPQRFWLIGSRFSEEEKNSLQAITPWPVGMEAWSPRPDGPEPAADFAPPALRAAREARQRRAKRRMVLSLAAAAYGGIVVGLAAVLVLGSARVRDAQEAAKSLEPAAREAREAVSRWTVLRQAADPGSFALDLLAAVAAALPSESVRFTRCALGAGRIELAGEAADVSQTYELLERLKSSAALAEYDWTARPPEIAGRDIVRFDIVGRRPDANAQPE